MYEMFGILCLMGFVTFGFFMNPPKYRTLYLAAFICKMAFGVVLGCIYFYYYGVGDTLYYDGVATTVFNETSRNFGFFLDFLFADLPTAQALIPFEIANNRTLLFIKILSSVYLLAAGNYWIAGAYFSFFSFSGSFYAFRIWAKYHKGGTLSIATMALVLFVPSLATWSAGVLKEPVVVGALFYVFGILIYFKNNKKLDVKLLVGLLVMGLLILKIKYYVFALLVFGLVVYGALAYLNKKRSIKTFITSMAALGLCLFMIQWINPNLHYSNFFAALIENYKAYDLLEVNGPRINLVQLMPSVADSFQLGIEIIIQGIFRPWIWEKGNFLVHLASIENALLLFLLVSNWKHIKLKLLGNNTFDWKIIVGIFLVVTFLFTISTPVLGTLIRYKSYYAYIIWILALQNHPLLIKQIDKVSFIKKMKFEGN